MPVVNDLDYRKASAMTTLALDSQTAEVSAYGAREKLRTYASRALARLRLQEALNATALVLTVSFWFLVTALLADKIFALQNIGIPIWILWGGVSMLGIPYVLWRVYTPSLHENLAAVLADDRLGLHARISSALTLDLKDPSAAAFSAAFFEEALQRTHAIKVEQAFPIRTPKAYALLLVPVLAGMGIYFYMPEQDLFGVVAARDNKRKSEEVIRKAGLALESRLPLEDMKKKADESSSEESGQYKIKQLMQKAETIAQELKAGKRNPDEALATLGDLKKEIQREKEKLTENKDFLSQLEKLSAKDLNLEESDLTKAVSEALKMGDPGLAARQMRKLAQDVKNDILNNPNKSEEQKKQELQKLQREVEKLAGALAENEALREHLKELSENVLSKSDFENLEKEIKKHQQKGQSKLGDQIEQAMEESAQELERLEEDNDANLNEEEEKEMEKLENAEEGVDEAMQGLNGEENQGEKEGKEANGQPGGKQGGKPAPGGKQGGTRHVGAGKKKSHSMSGSASGQGKEGGQGSKQGNAGQGDKDGQKGNRPGSGADGGGQGQGSRPIREIADPGFKAEKVKGKMQSGAITGLSHFRGQGAKGEAPAEFVKILNTAAQDASSSLELDRVPADAREVVKDYFQKVKQGANIPTTEPAAQPKKEALGE